MELGNMLFGHSRGQYVIDRASAACDMLGDLMHELAVTGYGRCDDDIANHHPTPAWLVETDRGVDIIDPDSREPLMHVRAYWWGDTDTMEDRTEAARPNLEAPALDLEIRWYKYMFRDAYANKPVTPELVDDLRRLLQPALDAACPYVTHPKPVPVTWTEHPGEPTRWTFTTTGEHDSGYTHGSVSIGRTDPEAIYDPAWPVTAECRTDDDTFTATSTFRDIDDAKAWCQRQTRVYEKA